ncbi:MAG: hypothetical protein ACREIA_07390 [Opitutaceae bacterium]
MDNERIKDVLSAYRPHGADRGDPAFAEALDRARADHGLNAWFEKELAGDRAIAATLLSIETPSDLKARILAGTFASAPTRPRRLPDWKTAAASLAAAASIALAIFTLWPRKPVSSFDTIIAAAAAESLKTPDLAFYSSSPLELIAWLNENDTPAPGSLPQGLAGLPTVGCRKLTWDGVPASLLGFRLAPPPGSGAPGRAAGSLLFLYTVNQSSCSGGVAGREPVVFSREDQSVATWRDQTRFYILVASIPEESLRNILRETPAIALAATGEAGIFNHGFHR